MKISDDAKYWLTLLSMITGNTRLTSKGNMNIVLCSGELYRVCRNYLPIEKTYGDLNATQVQLDTIWIFIFFGGHSTVGFDVKCVRSHTHLFYLIESATFQKCCICISLLLWAEKTREQNTCKSDLNRIMTERPNICYIF